MCVISSKSCSQLFVKSDGIVEHDGISLSSHGKLRPSIIDFRDAIKVEYIN